MKSTKICKSCEGLGEIITKDLILHTEKKRLCGLCGGTGLGDDILDRLDKEYWDDQESMGEWTYGK